MAGQDEKVNLLPGGIMKICPTNPAHKFFTTTAVICQDWLVDGEGNFIEVREECTDIFARPQIENIWECDECGAEAEDRSSDEPPHDWLG
jgi:hypothetical protein